MENKPGLSGKEIQVEISDDFMEATVYLSKPLEPDAEYSYEEVINELTYSGVKMGIDRDKVHQIVDNQMYDMHLIVAKGKPQIDGEDGYYDFNFDTDLKAKPVVKEDGSVDYYNIKLYEKATEGDLLAKYTPPTKGSFGFNVYGKLLVPSPGKPKSPLHGKGFCIGEDGVSYYAALSGKIEYCNYDLKVVNVLDVTGDVDLNIGNINFNGDVNISGNVIAGVTISAMGNIYIGGYVEGATILSNKDIVLNKGINANGSGRVEAKGSISARFIENTDVLCGGDLKVGYILNSNVVSKGKILVEGGKGTIHGGNVTGILGIETANVGNSSYSPTVLKVGATKKLRMDYANLIVKMKEIESTIDMYNSALDKLNTVKKLKPELYDATAYTKICQSKIIKTAEKSKCEQESNYMAELIRDAGKAVVKISSKLYPGTKIYIDNKSYEPVDTIIHVIVRKFNDSIVVRDYED